MTSPPSLPPQPDRPAPEPAPSARAARKPILLYVAAEDRAFLSHRLPMARAALAAGFDVHVATNDGPGRAAIEAEGFVVQPIPIWRGRASTFATLRTIVALRGLYRRLRPTLAHHSGLQPSVIGAIAASGLGIATINAMTGMGFVFTADSAQTRRLRRIIGWIARTFMNGPRSTALVQNPDDWNALVQFGIAAERIALIPGSGVDTDALQPIPEPDGPVTLGFAGRLLSDKGIRALVAAVKIVRGRGLDIRLLVAGTTDPANPASVSEAEAEAWQSEDGIALLGQIDDIRELWRRAHIAVLPSHREGLPKTLLEAASCARPMIATDVPGCREIAIQNQTALLVPVEDAAAIADAITTLASDPQMRSRFGRAARAKVEHEMSARAVGQAIVELYRRALTR